MSTIATGTLIAQGLLLALDLYRDHNNLAEDWVPTEEDWDALESEVKLMTAQQFKDEAKAALPTGEFREPSPTPAGTVNELEAPPPAESSAETPP